MKILLIAYRFSPELGGIQTYSQNLAEALTSLGHEVTVLCRKREGVAASDRKWPFSVWRYGGDGVPWLKVIFLIFTLRKLIRSHSFDVWHCVNWVPMGIPAIFARKPNTPLIFSCHGSEVMQWEKNPIRKIIRNWVLNRSNGIIPGSHFLEHYLNRQGILPQKKVTYYGIVQKDPPLSGHSHYSKKILLSVCDLKPRKGIDYVLKALPHLKEQGIEFEYWIIGFGTDEKRLKHLIKKLKLEQQVFLKGKTTERDLFKSYADCDLFILMSRQEINGDVEGFGLVFLEAASFGKPVIAGESGGIPEAVLDGETGLLVAPRDLKGIQFALLSLLQDPEKCHRLGAAGKVRIGKEFLAEHIAAKTVSFYQEILKGFI